MESIEDTIENINSLLDYKSYHLALYKSGLFLDSYDNEESISIEYLLDLFEKHGDKITRIVELLNRRKNES